jgi:predicted nucleotidyltransferase
MTRQHEDAIALARDRLMADPDVVALIVIGSVARGDARDGSDVDLVIVLTEDALRQRAARSELSYRPDDLGTRIKIGGGFVDLNFLHDVADRGPEPSRFAFLNARLVFSRSPAIAGVLERIPVYQESERVEKMISFVSQLPVHMSYLALGEYSHNAWLLAQTAVELVLFGGRLILAHNRILFPNRKQFIRVLASAPEQPDGLIGMVEALMTAPSIANAKRFHDAVMDFRDWTQAPEGAWARFQLDRETNWRETRAALADS